MLRNFIHENKLGLCAIGIVLGLPMVILGILSQISSDIGLVQWSHDIIGDWVFWVILFGFIFFIPGIYYIVDFIMKLREFKELMATNSKAIFIKNQDRIEELAWRLHPKYERMVIKKKEKLKLR